MHYSCSYSPQTFQRDTDVLLRRAQAHKLALEDQVQQDLARCRTVLVDRLRAAMHAVHDCVTATRRALAVAVGHEMLQQPDASSECRLASAIFEGLTDDTDVNLDGYLGAININTARQLEQQAREALRLVVSGDPAVAAFEWLLGAWMAAMQSLHNAMSSWPSYLAFVTATRSVGSRFEAQADALARLKDHVLSAADKLFREALACTSAQAVSVAAGEIFAVCDPDAGNNDINIMTLKAGVDAPAIRDNLTCVLHYLLQCVTACCKYYNLQVAQTAMMDERLSKAAEIARRVGCDVRLPQDDDAAALQDLIKGRLQLQLRTMAGSLTAAVPMAAYKYVGNAFALISDAENKVEDLGHAFLSASYLMQQVRTGLASFLDSFQEAIQPYGLAELAEGQSVRYLRVAPADVDALASMLRCTVALSDMEVAQLDGAQPQLVDRFSEALVAFQDQLMAHTGLAPALQRWTSKRIRNELWFEMYNLHTPQQTE